MKDKSKKQEVEATLEKTTKKSLDEMLLLYPHIKKEEVLRVKEVVNDLMGNIYELNKIVSSFDCPSIERDFCITWDKGRLMPCFDNEFGKIAIIALEHSDL